MQGVAVVDHPRGGAENMALDDQMLELAAGGDQVIVRLYRWSAPCLSLGYFQRAVDRELHPESQGIELVRRSTGGGAIVHHHEWTYSVAVPNSRIHSSIGSAPDLVNCVHQSIVDILCDLGWNARQCETAETCGGSQPFLCFERRSCGDVLVEDHKVLGSAQRRSRSALLQHGSLLLRRSECAPNLPGLTDLRSPKRRFSESVEVKGQVSSSAVDGGEDHVDGLRMSEVLARVCENISVHLDISFEFLRSIRSLPLNPIELGKFADAKWTNRR